MTTAVTNAQPKQKAGSATKGGGGFWSAWVGANAVGELVGLAIPAAVAVTWAQAAHPSGRTAMVAFAAAMIVAGTLEGTIIGYAQWRVLRSALPAGRACSWIGWTALGAGIAWTLGMIPSTLLHDATRTGAAPPPELNWLVKYSLAALLGAALGPMLGVTQWVVLRRHMARAAWWIPANALAWAVGMPIVFVGAGHAPHGIGLASLITAGAVTLSLAGAVVGAIHGFVLLRLLTLKATTQPQAEALCPSL